MQLPVVVKMFVQAGACVGKKYCNLIRDVSVPGVVEENLVV